MTFQQWEISQSQGEPVELYEAAVGSQLFGFTTSEDGIQIGATNYTPVEISRERIIMGPEERQDALNVTMPAGNPLALLYRQAAPGQVATLTIKRFHRPDGANPQTLTIFKGRVQSVAYENNGTTAKLAVVPVTSGRAHEMPRFTFQALCNHVLYDGQCQVLQSQFRHIGQVLSIDGAVMNVDGANTQPNGWFTGGFAQLAGGTDWRLILAHTGNSVTLVMPFSSNPTGTQIEIFAGCAHDINTCSAKFDNVPNYGGFAFVPLTNPFSSGIT
jgi:uncharacterized phage protein (TIGR02218 family)